MINNKILYIIIAVLVFVLIGSGLFFFFSNQSSQKEIGADQPSTAEQAPVTDETMVDCGEAEDPGCFLNRMNGCLPVTTKGTGSDGSTTFEITILGVENEKCHFQRKINNVLDLDCYFPKGTLNGDTLDQMFGNDNGLQDVVDAACSMPGW